MLALIFSHFDFHYIIAFRRGSNVLHYNSFEGQFEFGTPDFPAVRVQLPRCCLFHPRFKAIHTSSMRLETVISDVWGFAADAQGGEGSLTLGYSTAAVTFCLQTVHQLWAKSPFSAMHGEEAVRPNMRACCSHAYGYACELVCTFALRFTCTEP